MLHDPDRTDATCFFMAHGASDRTLPHWAGSERERVTSSAGSQSATVPTGFRFPGSARRPSRRR